MSSATVGLGHLLRRSRDKAVIDRYGLVRKFFIRQASTAAPSGQAPVALSRYSAATFTQTEYPGIPKRKITWVWGQSVALLTRPNIPSRQFVNFSGSRYVHTTPRLEQDRGSSREDQPLSERADSQNDHDQSGKPQAPTHHDPRPLENYSKFFRQLALSLPHVHRPTRDDFLNAASGFWQRMRVRFKWLTIRSFRKYNADEISAFITWFFMSQTLWLLVGT